jgi:membrane protein DedA with SNARE-associated domain
LILPDILHHVSYLGIIFVLILTGSGLPIPEEVPIIAAGVAASVGTLNPWYAFISCLIGALAGDSVMYSIGYHFGHSLVVRHPRLAQMLHAEHEAKIEQMLAKHGWKVLLVSRFMVGVRAPFYLTTGILRMPFRRFLLADSFCAAAVVGFFFWLGYAFGENLTNWIRNLETKATLIAGVAVALVVFWLIGRRFLRKRLSVGDGDSYENCEKRSPEESEVIS